MRKSMLCREVVLMTVFQFSDNANLCVIDDGRTIKMTQEVFNLLTVRVSLERGKTITFFLTRSGEPVKDFRGAWWVLCEKCDLGKFVKVEDDKLRWEGLLFHDLGR
jgi:hypothetical protein